MEINVQFKSELGVHFGAKYPGDIVNAEKKGMYTEGNLQGYNDGVYDQDDVNGGRTVMYTSQKSKMLVVNLYNGKVEPGINDKNAFTSVIDHEGGPIGHLVNPNKLHSDIYKDQISKYGSIVPKDYLKELVHNFQMYLNEEKK